MVKIKLIDENSVLPKLYPMDWDVVINDRKYYVVKIEGFVHTIGEEYVNNDLWAYPRNEEPSYKNLIEFNCDKPVCWGIVYAPYNYTKCKWDECEVRTCAGISITRNGEKFSDVIGGLPRAQVMISEFQDHPLDLNMIDFDKKIIGRKVWWRSEPAVITHYCKGQACVILEPDSIESFTTPAEFSDENDCYEDGNVKADILDKHIWWFKD